MMMLNLEQNYEKMAIDQLRGYKRLVGRIKMLEKYPVSGGMRLGTIVQDGQLQDLHRQWRKLAASGADQEALRSAEAKIKALLEGQMGTSDGYQGILARVSELEELGRQKEQMERAMDALDDFKHEYAQVLKLLYVDGNEPHDIACDLGISLSTFYGWRRKALKEYGILIS
ncbi:DUF1492 domain-containing protein [Paenibacillus oleatilyticus]|uniref:DUF1492 domain-containing protein n=1 Tax=Paenibacillus oleatilyticus TaxID=2594886 RepID=UPI001C1F5E56|nr:DUF1492 domain-containing protein [Paenibacillus oleatilyticus]MBU7318638.1 DUF1492 domain-containing protein [Paenibacillus oleatilyticus]